MRIKKLGSLIGLSAALLLGSLTAAQAQGPGIYFGASWGAYSIKESTLNDNGRVLKGVVGAQFNNWFGVEGSWTDFNRADNGTDRFKADGKGLAAVLSAPLGNRSSVFIKGGQFWWNADSVLGVSAGADTSRKGHDLFWGGGFKFGFNPHLALRVEYERYDVVETHLNTVTGGLEFKF